MKHVALWALVLAAPAYAETPDYPPNLFEHSPEIGTDHTKKWTHMPDGRWMFVDPNQTQGKMCDFEHQCYPDTAQPSAPPTPQASVPSHAEAPTALAPDALMPNGTPARDPWCLGVAQRLFGSLGEVLAAHQRCDHAWPR